MLADAWANSRYRGGVATRPPISQDPLAIDLDGDGIETTGITGTPILFDHNADGIRTGTGWVKGDDAWLAMDRDGNGLIDSGRELFGVDTLISGTPGVDAVYASSGFQALKTLDKGNGTVGSAGYGDNLFDSRDAAFTQVRLWQDLNQDGISQSTELFTLAQKNIASISLSATTTTINLGNGNTVSGTAAVTRSNGSTTLAETVSVASDTRAANLFLGVNPFYREFTTAIPLTTTAQALPDMGGSGWVRDLREAMSLGTAQGNALAAKVQALAAATTRDAQMALLDDLLRLWAETNQSHAVPAANDPARRFVLVGDATTSAKLQAAIPILEVFNGLNVDDAGMQIPVVSTVNGQPVRTYNLFANQAPTMLQAYEALQQSVYGALVVQTRLNPYLDAIELIFGDDALRFDTAALSSLLDARKTVNERNVVLDLIDLNRYARDTLQATGFAGMDKLAGWVNALPGNAPLRTELAGLRVFTAIAPGSTGGDDILLGDNAANSFAGGAGDDQFQGGAGDDMLQGGAGNDTLDGGTGNDTLAGGDYSGDSWSYYYRGAGNDTYLFGWSDGQDTIRDTDITANNQDTIVFKAGVAVSDVQVVREGNNLVLRLVGSDDRISMEDFFAYDSTGGNQIEQVRFTDDPGTVWTMADLRSRVLTGGYGNDVITGYAANDTLEGWDGNDALYGLDGDDILMGGRGDDSMEGGVSGNDTLKGNAGNDVLVGGTGDDSLEGGAGQDVLIGDEGNDTFDGGAGNDKLGYDGANDFSDYSWRSRGNDTYLFGYGDGQDKIYDIDTTPGNQDTILFKAGVSSQDVRIVRDALGLRLEFRGGVDMLRLQSGTLIEQVRFTDEPAVLWTAADLAAASPASTAGNDTLTGSSANNDMRGGVGQDVLTGGTGNDVLSGNEGNDSLQGDADNDRLIGGTGVDLLQGGYGNDTLDGGSGNDTLAGGSYGIYVVGPNAGSYYYDGPGNDTYLFGRGDGRDTVYDFDATGGNVDTIMFKAGVAVGDVRASIGLGDKDLVLSIVGTGDQVTVRNHFQGEGTEGWQVEEIRFTDAPGTVWRYADVRAMQLVGGARNDSLTGFSGADTMLGGGGNDLLEGRNGDDVLDGGTGNDTLAGGVYQSSAYAYAAPGKDTYLFGKGDGRDSVYDVDATVGVMDQIIFKAGVAVSEVRARRIQDALVLEVAGTEDQLRVPYFFSGTDSRVEQIRFTDAPSTVWNAADLVVQFPQNEATVYVYGYSSGETLAPAGDAQDYIYGGGGNDTLRGGAGDDMLDGEADSDRLFGNAGFDALYGGAGDDQLYGGKGSDTLFGGANADTLDGGSGDDLMFGGNVVWSSGTSISQSTAGNDTYLFGRGDGLDRIYDDDDAVGNMDKLVFKAGVAVADVQTLRDGDTLAFNIVGTADQIRIEGFFSSDEKKVEKVLFTDDAAIEWTAATFNALFFQGTAGNDVLRGSAALDTLQALAGDDVVYGYAGDDELRGGAGQDTLYGGEGEDYLSGDSESDGLFGEAGDDRLDGLNGDDTLYGGTGDDKLQGGNGNDVLDGGAGNDLLLGGEYSSWIDGNYQQAYSYAGPGSDTYRFGVGDGRDLIYDVDSVGTPVDRIEFKAGVSVGSVRVGRYGDALLLDIAGTNDQLRVEGYFGGEGTNGWQVEEIHFADAPGVVWSVEDVKARLLAGTDADDVSVGFSTADIIAGAGGTDDLKGNGGNDQISGGDDNDLLQGNAGNDTLDGGAGNDILVGGTRTETNFGPTYDGVGDDVYLFDRGYEQDAIWDVDATSGNMDAIRLKDNVRAEDVRLKRPAGSNNLVLSISATSDTLTVSNFFAGASNVVERLQFADGSQWDLGRLALQPVGATGLLGTVNGDVLVAGDGHDIVQGMVGADVLLGGVGNDDLRGDEGNDSLFGHEGADRLNGGSGADRLEGGTGNDTYLFNLGDGQDSIQDSDAAMGNMDTVSLGAGISPNAVTVNRFGDDMVLNYSASDSITVKNWFAGDLQKIERITFSDGGITWDVARIAALSGDGNDAPTGNNLSAAETYTEDLALNLTDIIAADVDSANLTAMLTLSNIAAGSLNVATSGAVTSTYNATTGIWNASGATANVNTLLAALTFTPTTNFNGNFTVATSVSDGVAAAVTGIKAFTGLAVNDAPVASNLNTSEAYTEDIALNLIDIVAADIDSANLTVKLTLSNVAAGSLNTGTSGPVISTYNAATGIWTASGATATVNVLLAALTFTPAANFNGSFTVATSVSDGVAPAVTGSKTFAGVAVNDAPSASNLGAAETYTEDVALNLIDIVAADIDSAYLTVKLTLSNVAAGSLNTGTSGPVTSTYNAATGIWSASGATANVNALLAALTFTPSANFNGSFALATSVSDGVTAAVTGSKTFSGVAVNDAATANNLNAAQTYTEDVALNLIDIVAADIDSPNLTVKLTLSNVAAGSLTTGTSGAVTSTYNAATGVWTASGATASVNTLLVALTFTPSANFNGSFTMATSVSDGTAAPVTGSKSFTGVAVNDAPTAVNVPGTRQAVETQVFSYVLPGNAFADVDAGDPLALSATLPGGAALPGWLAFNSATRVLSGTPPDTAAGIVGIQFKATDAAGAFATSLLTLDIANFVNGTAGADVLAGTSGRDVMLGLAGNDDMNGGAGDDLVNGGAGNDVLVGGAGDDVFLVNGLYDGVDMFAGDAGFNTILGGAGDDTITVSQYRGYWTVEMIDGGLGINVFAGDSLANVMDLSSTQLVRIAEIAGGAGADSITGSTGNDVIVGGVGDDRIDGWSGDDTLIGGDGDDTFVVDGLAGGVDAFEGDGGYNQIVGTEADERITVSQYRGVWTVQKIDGGAGHNVFAGNGAGNIIDLSSTQLLHIDEIDGGAGDDNITGSAGGDTIKGGTGDDRLDGWSGNDTYLYGRGEGWDTILEDDSTAGNTDIVRFGSGIAADQLWFRQMGNDLEVFAMGSVDGLSVRNWYLGDRYQVEEFKTSNGKTLLDSQVQNLVSAMAAFAPPAMGQATLPAAYASQLNGVIAANWQ